MQFRTPKFWSHNGPASYLLRPAAWLYGAIAKKHFNEISATTTSIDIPVICVGNLTVGGAGKTPLALLLGRMLTAEGIKVHFLTRGYGGLEDAVPVQVDPAKHSYRQVGDEALLLAACATCWVTADRVAGAQMAQASGADIIIMDDGFQNPSLHKNLSIVVVDGSYGFGNGRLFPAGPLREPVKDGLLRADAVVVVGDDKHHVSADIPQETPTLNASIIPSGHQDWLHTTPLVAFAGIGNPQKFFSMLQEMGCDLRAHTPFPDHYRFRNKDLEQLVSLAQAHQAKLVTTEKDMVRIPHELYAHIRTVPVEMQITNREKLNSLLSPLLTHIRQKAIRK